MGTKPAGPAGEVAALALELVERISAISTFPGPEPVAAPGSATPSGGPDFTGPRALLENGARFVAPVLPADARLKPLKGVLLRIFRIVTRDQTTFNSAILEALRGTLEKVEDGLRALGARTAETHEEIARKTAELEALLVSLSDALHGADAREAAARESVEREVAASQRRLDALERDRDRRAEALERRWEELLAERSRLVAGLSETQEALRALKLEWTAVRRDLRERPAVSAVEGGAAPVAGPPDAGDALRAGLYTDFESRFRGTEEEIRARQRRDVALFSGAPGPVADLGCGRGEFLEEVRAAGLTAVGCDANPVMVARAKEKGLSVQREDLFRWLSARRDGSLGGITAYQVVEHLPPSSLFDLVELALAKLAPKGRLLFETINPESVYAMKWFWMDLTHVRPVPAPALAQLMTASGLRNVTIDYRSPVPQADAPPAEAAGDPRLAAIARLLFAPQDYAVTGVK